MARPGRFELPTLCLEGRRSIQLSYGRTMQNFLSLRCFSNSSQRAILSPVSVCARPLDSLHLEYDYCLSLNAAICKAQAEEAVAVALTGPSEGAILSSVRLPPKLDLTVKPVPAVAVPVTQ
jgi:hypothetical protein